jgi:hypothetical protein
LKRIQKDRGKYVKWRKNAEKDKGGRKLVRKHEKSAQNSKKTKEKRIK